MRDGADAIRDWEEKKKKTKEGKRVGKAVADGTNTYLIGCMSALSYGENRPIRENSVTPRLARKTEKSDRVGKPDDGEKVSFWRVIKQSVKPGPDGNMRQKRKH